MRFLVWLVEMDPGLKLLEFDLLPRLVPSGFPPKVVGVLKDSVQLLSLMS